MRFVYTATNQEGKTVKGQTEGQDRASVVEALHKQGLKPIIVRVSTSKAAHAKGKKVKLKEC